MKDCQCQKWYFEADDFDTLLSMNILFLEGKQSSPLYGFSDHYVDHETLNFLDELIECNSLGFLTTDSQQGLIDTSPTDQTLYMRIYQQLLLEYPNGYGGLDSKGIQKLQEEYLQLGGSFTDHIVLSQRAYLVGLVTLDLAIWMVARLNLIDDIVAYYVPCNDGGAVSAGGQIPVTFEEKDTSSIGSHFDGILENSKGHLRPVTFLDASNQLERFRFCLSPDFFSQVQMDLASLYIIDTKHGRAAEGFLLKSVIECLKTKHLK